MLLGSCLALTACNNKPKAPVAEVEIAAKTEALPKAEEADDRSARVAEVETEALPKAEEVPVADNANQIQTGTMQDKAGQSYKTVVINGKTWMAENMRYAATAGKYFHVNDSAANDAVYGLLYDWQAAKTVCPEGWHLPNKTEFDELAEYVERHSNNALSLIAKSGLWKYYPDQGLDEFGFGALPAGYYEPDAAKCTTEAKLVGACDPKMGSGRRGLWWSSTKNAPDSAYYLYIESDEVIRKMNGGRGGPAPTERVRSIDYGVGDDNSLELGFSVRCLQNSN